MLELFIENNLISKNQSGFRPGDSCINQLLVFLYISKAFDKVCHKGFIFRLKQNAISDKILNIITDFLSFTKQQVILNGKPPPPLVLY